MSRAGPRRGRGSAAGASGGAGLPAQLARAVPASCPAGRTLVAPTGGTTDALGVMHLTYRGAPGFQATVPPRGLTAAKVTPALLADLGMAPATGAAPATRSRIVQTVVARGQAAQAPEYCMARVSPAAAKAQAIQRVPNSAQAAKPGVLAPVTNAHAFSVNWSGYALTEAENGGGPIEGVQGAWTQGGDNTPSTDSPGAESTWVGIGGGLGEGGASTGDFNGGLIQTGTSMMTDYGYQSWFEVIGYTGGAESSACNGDDGTACDVQYSGVDDVRPGDSIWATVYWVSTSEACFSLVDSTNAGGSYSGCQSSLGSSAMPYDHTSAEWINEGHVNMDQGWCPPNAGGENCTGSGAKPQLIKYYDNPGTTDWSQQLFTGSFGDAGPFVDPFTKSYQAEVMYPSGNAGPTSPTGCSSGPDTNAVLSYPANPGGSTGDPTSQIFTCSNSIWD